MANLVAPWIFPALWIAWSAYWWAASRDAKPTARRETVDSRLLHIVPLAIAVALLAVDRVPPPLGARLYPRAAWEFWAGVLVTAAGLAFSVVARRHIGRNWSGTVTIKESHELVTSGPYRLVRHPIYTGILLAFAGSAIARGDWRGVVALAIAWAALWRKLSVEERWMLEQFGEAYAAYRRRVPALVPFVRALGGPR